MRCSKPFVRGGEEFGCGQCMPCRINKRRLWVTRLHLEAGVNPPAFFLTFTYDEKHLPLDGSLDRWHLHGCFKRVRSAGVRFRFFAVGEYGDHSFRPHYHAVIFGVPYESISVFQEKWGMGFVDVKVCEGALFDYIAGYVCKKMTRSDDKRLNGRYPEYSRMSKRPGIGAGAVSHLSGVTTTQAGALHMSSTGDVPGVVRLDGKLRPIGPYLKRLLRSSAGYDSKRSAMAHLFSSSRERALGREFIEVQREVHAAKAVRITKRRKGSL